jgi:hypothetical protein
LEDISEEEQWEKVNTDRKSSSYMRRIVSKNHTTTGAQVTAELKLEDPVSTKTVRRELHKSSVYRKAAVAKPLIKR